MIGLWGAIAPHIINLTWGLLYDKMKRKSRGVEHGKKRSTI